MIYKPPQIPLELEVEAIVDDYLSDYRRMYIERPRLRLDGVYIAVCHYVYVFNYGFRPHLGIDNGDSQPTGAERKCLGHGVLYFDLEIFMLIFLSCR